MPGPACARPPGRTTLGDRAPNSLSRSRASRRSCSAGTGPWPGRAASPLATKSARADETGSTCRLAPAATTPGIRVVRPRLPGQNVASLVRRGQVTRGRPERPASLTSISFRSSISRRPAASWRRGSGTASSPGRGLPPRQGPEVIEAVARPDRVGQG